jgi:hypothetical protein
MLHFIYLLGSQGKLMNDFLRNARSNLTWRAGCDLMHLFWGAAMNINTIKEHFSIICDEQQSATVDYPLFDIFFGAHWSIESMHCILDVSMREDACQIYR